MDVLCGVEYNVLNDDDEFLFYCLECGMVVVILIYLG